MGKDPLDPLMPSIDASTPEQGQGSIDDGSGVDAVDRMGAREFDDWPNSVSGLVAVATHPRRVQLVDEQARASR